MTEPNPILALSRTLNRIVAATVILYLALAVLVGVVFVNARHTGKVNRGLIQRTSILSHENARAIVRLEALQREAVKSCVARHKIVVALREVSRVNSRGSGGETKKNWQRLGIGIRTADCNAAQLKRSQQQLGDMPKVQVEIRYRNRTIRVGVPGHTRTIRVPGPATVRVDTVTVTVAGPTVTTPGETRTVTVTRPGRTVTQPGRTVTQPGKTTTVTTPGKPKPCPPKNPHCKP